MLKFIIYTPIARKAGFPSGTTLAGATFGAVDPAEGAVAGGAFEASPPVSGITDAYLVILRSSTAFVDNAMEIQGWKMSRKMIISNDGVSSAVIGIDIFFTASHNLRCHHSNPIRSREGA